MLMGRWVGDLGTTVVVARADSSWPPILSFLVIGGAIAAIVATIVLVRQLHAAARDDGRRK